MGQLLPTLPTKEYYRKRKRGLFPDFENKPLNEHVD